MSSFLNLPVSNFGQPHWRTALKQRWTSSNIAASIGTGTMAEGSARPPNIWKMHPRAVLKERYRKEREDHIDIAIQHSPPHDSALGTRVFTLDDEKSESSSTTTNPPSVSHCGQLPLRGIRCSERIRKQKGTPQP
jgi:hypothetical protein